MNPLLLGDPSPTLRWRALTELGGAPIDDTEVGRLRAEARAEVDRVCGTLARRPGLHQTAYLLCRLAYLGYDGPVLAQGAERVFAQQLRDGSWPEPRVQPLDAPAQEPPLRAKARRASKAPPVQRPVDEKYPFMTVATAIPLRGVASAGFATDPRAERAYEWLLAHRLDDGAWPGGAAALHGGVGDQLRADRHSTPQYRRLADSSGCRSATTAAVACYALHPELCRSQEARLGLDHLLRGFGYDQASLGFEISRLLGLEPAQGQLTFYVTPDPAFLLDLSSRLGASIKDSRISELVWWLGDIRGPYGLWQHEAHPQLSRWLSFDIESSLQRLERGDWVGTGRRASFTPYKKGRRRY